MSKACQNWMEPDMQLAWKKPQEHPYEAVTPFELPKISTYSLWYLDTFEPSKFYLLFIYINHVYNIYALDVSRLWTLTFSKIFQDVPRFSKDVTIISPPSWWRWRWRGAAAAPAAGRWGPGPALRASPADPLGKEVDLDPPQLMVVKGG